jgi:hypothetical protein
MKIRVKSLQVFERKIVSPKNGKQYTFREQEALVSMGDEVRVFVLSLGDDQAPYPEGEYEVLPESLDVDRNRNLAFKRRLALKPVSAAAGVAPGQPRPISAAGVR